MSDDASKIINDAATRKAPAFNKGLQGLDIKKFLAESTSHDIRSLMARNFALWAQLAGVKVDGRVFTFEDRRYLLPIYMDHGQNVVWMKAAQLGATVYMLLRLLWYARYHKVNAALYFPTGGGVESLSKARLNPLIRSNPELLDNMTDTDTLGLKQIRNVHGTDSSLYMMYMGGKDSKDSTPLDILFFDEVRLMDPGDIDQVQERIAASDWKTQCYMSTAGLPETDIHARYMRGTQMVWHTICGCFPMDQKICVRKKGSANPEIKSFKELETEWQDYDALTWDNRRKQWKYQEITAFHNNGIREVRTYKFRNGQKITCTPDHEFAQVLGQKIENNKKLTWKTIDEIASSEEVNGGGQSKVAVARSLPDAGRHTNVSEVCLPHGELTLYTVGAFVAEGSWKTDGWISIAQKFDRKTTIRENVKIWANLQGLNYVERDDCIDICLTYRPDLKELFASCGTGCENKQFPEGWLSAPVRQIKHYLDGYLQGDGSTKISSDKRGYANNKVWTATTTSKTLVEQLSYIGLRMGTPLYVSEAMHREGKKQSWEVSHTEASAFNKARLGDDVSRVSISGYEEAGSVEVADITVAEEHHYVLASGFIVHNCSDGVVLPDVFPDCVVTHKKKDGTTETYYRCPRCKYRINDVRNGAYVPHNPGADYNSYSVSQLNSAKITAKEVFDFYQTTTNIKEFWNGKIGRPFVDEENRPITDDVFNACVNENLSWYSNLPSRRVKGGCAMGVDQHSGNCYVTIMKRGKDGKKQLVHLEVIESDNPIYWEYDENIGHDVPVTPFKRLYQLMDEFNVQMCVIDAMPNINEAYAFARKFPGKVFIAHYKDAGQDMVLWYDKAKTKEAIRKGSKETRMKWQVLLHRYAVLDFALKQWTDGAVEIPPVGKLHPLMRHPKTGRFEATLIASELRTHLKRLVRQETKLGKKNQQESHETGKSRMEWIYLGGDPHFAHSFSYCNIATERLRNRALFAF